MTEQFTADDLTAAIIAASDRAAETDDDYDVTLTRAGRLTVVMTEAANMDQVIWSTRTAGPSMDPEADAAAVMAQSE
jgi:hypothetical protein